MFCEWVAFIYCEEQKHECCESSFNYLFPQLVICGSVITRINFCNVPKLHGLILPKLAKFQVNIKAIENF